MKIVKVIGAIVGSMFGAVILTLLVQIAIFKIRNKKGGKFNGPLTMSGLINSNYDTSEIE